MVVQEQIALIKRKRSKRPKPSSQLALTMPVTASGSTSSGSGGGASSEEMTRGGNDDQEQKDMANCLMLLAKGQTTQTPSPPAAVNYGCKTCNKSFSSFQALGGHRASHTKPPIIKPTIGNNNNNKQEFFLSPGQGESTILSLQTPTGRLCSPGHDKVANRVHECSICGAGFASGQALGGHMRRHRPLQAVAAVSRHGQSPVQTKRLRTVLSLDLNLPAPEDNNNDHKRENELQVIVFSAAAPSLVDCHY